MAFTPRRQHYEGMPISEEVTQNSISATTQTFLRETNFK